MRRSTHGMAILALAVLWICPARAASVQIAAALDNTLCEDPLGGLSNGLGQHLFAGRTGGGAIRRGLVQFDVASAIPPGSSITAVRLGLYMSRSTAGLQTVFLHRVLSPWGEGASDAPDQEGMCAPATPGGATWTHGIFNTSPWNTAGGDLAGVVSATLDVEGIGAYLWGSTAAMVQDVQGWLDAPGTNHGWALVGEESAAGTSKRFDSRHHLTAGQRPVLLLEFTPPPPSVTIFPASGRLAETTGFDLTMIASVFGADIVGASVTLDGEDITSVVAGCIFGSVGGGGITLRCPALSGAFLGTGMHTFSVTLPLSQGPPVIDSVTWEVVASSEP